MAELTPAEVWDNLARYYTDMGYEMSVGARDETSDGLTLTDIEFTFQSEQGEAASTVTGTIPKVTLEQTNDTKVRTVFDGEMTFESTTEVPEQDPVAFNLVMTAPDNETISSGTVEDMLHEFNFPSLETGLYFAGNAQDANGGEAPVTLTLTDTTGQYRSVEAEDQEVSYEMISKAMDVALNISEPAAEDGTGGQGKVTGKAHVDGVSFTGTSSLPAGIDNMMERLDLALNAGFMAQGKVEMGEMTGDMTFENLNGSEEGPQSGDATFSAAESDLTFSMAKEGLTYAGNSGGTQVEANLSQLPFPISYAIESASGEATFPVSKSEEVQPFALKYELTGLTMADAIWDQFDPAKELPRDPANLKLDLAGEATVKSDLFDPAFGQQMAESAAEGSEPGAALEATPPMDAPFEPKSLKINEIALQAIGVDANMTGDLSFADSMSQPPVGVVEGDFKGVNALLDKLVAMGLVPQDQLMGARMMLAMFAKPAEGDPDHLQTKIEFKEGGSIFANGQQVK